MTTSPSPPRRSPPSSRLPESTSSPTGPDSSPRFDKITLDGLLTLHIQALESCDLKDLITKIGSGVGAAGPAAGGAAAGGAAPAAEAKKEEAKKEESEEEEDDDMGFGLFD